MGFDRSLFFGSSARPSSLEMGFDRSLFFGLSAPPQVWKWASIVLFSDIVCDVSKFNLGRRGLSVYG
jgi:hypothetical protein